jgi:prolyl-tRNA synthetase
MGTLVEIYNDEKGIVWPENVAPFKYYLTKAGSWEFGVSRVEEIYKKLTEAALEVLWDDRDDVSAGQKFADADLLGIPHRLVVSPKLGDKIELKKRTEHEVRLVELEELI